MKSFIVTIILTVSLSTAFAEGQAVKKMTIKEAIEIATNEVPGKVLEVVVVANHYEVRILTFDNKKVVVKVDPRDRMIEKKRVFKHAPSKEVQ